MAKIFLDKKGLAEYEAEIEKTKLLLNEALSEKSSAVQNDVNSWHDNAAYDYAKQSEIRVQSELNRLLSLRSTIEIISRGTDNSVIDIGDTVVVNMKYSSSNTENSTFLLTANYMPKLSSADEIREVSINSPIGTALYKKQVGDTINYNVGNRAFSGEIISLEKPIQTNDEDLSM